MELLTQINECVQYIRQITHFQPKLGLILGTGLGNFSDSIRIIHEIPYSEIPHFPISTVQSHKGKLQFGYLGDVAVVILAGRFHYYEGYTMQQVTFPVRVLKYLGISHLFITNVAGSTNPDINAGDLVFIKDHINLLPENPLRGSNDERIGVRFPDMKDTYDKTLIQKAKKIAQDLQHPAHEGVYVALQGPNLETPAEYRYLNTIGGDVVGMSTVPEVIVARHASLTLFVVSVVSNKCFPIETIQHTTLEDVIAIAQNTEPIMTTLLHQLAKEI